jgi:hypothetical protein
MNRFAVRSHWVPAPATCENDVSEPLRSDQIRPSTGLLLRRRFPLEGEELPQIWSSSEKVADEGVGEIPSNGLTHTIERCQMFTVGVSHSSIPSMKGETSLCML